jgi:hypothetical protein
LLSDIFKSMSMELGLRASANSATPAGSSPMQAIFSVTSSLWEREK